jgi:hypothetical protein
LLTCRASRYFDTCLFAPTGTSRPAFPPECTGCHPNRAGCTRSSTTGALMARGICEGCQSLDVRQLHRKDLLQPGLRLPWSRNNELAGTITIETEHDALMLIYRSHRFGPNGEMSGNAFQSPGPNATLVADAPGSNATSNSMGGIAEEGSQRFTTAAFFLLAGTAVAWATRANRNRCANEAYSRRGKSGCAWAG